MFKISRRLDYGVQLMIALAASNENKAQSTAVLSKKLSIPLPFLHQIAHSLMQAGYIKATPGPHGGLRLNLRPEMISILQIVEALEGPVSMNPCEECAGDCEREPFCSSLLVWNDLQTKITLHLESITLNALCHQAEKFSLHSLPLANQVDNPVINRN